MARIRKTKPEVVAQIDALLNEYCDREVAEILNQRGTSDLAEPAVYAKEDRAHS